MTDSPRTHRLDAGQLSMGILSLALGLAFGPAATINAGSLVLIPLGIYALSFPTLGGRVRIDTDGRHVTLRFGRAISISWRAVGSWALVPKPLFPSHSLVLWPSEDATPDLHQVAHKSGARSIEAGCCRHSTQRPT